MAGPITHVIVVMLENRSYDNILGGLYHRTNQPPYRTPPPGQAHLNGLTGDETNPKPGSPGQTIQVANQTAPTTDPRTGLSYPATTIPIFDPGEPFHDMAQQFLGLPRVPKRNPYQPPLYPPPAASAAQGFTTNYAQATSVPAANVPDIMNFFTPAQLPVTAWLAHHFAVCDQWFASAPTQTFANRVFAHCAASGVTHPLIFSRHSLIDDVQYLTDSLVELPSIFSRLDTVHPDTVHGSPPNWKVYFHDYSITVGTMPYVWAKAVSRENVNVATLDQADWRSRTPDAWFWSRLGAVPSTFMEDLARKKLPKYSFIEPRYSCNWAAFSHPSNSDHPGGSNILDDTPGLHSPPTDTANGQVLLLQVYNALRESSYWDKSLLIVTYDEHGGTYDHVVPPRGIAPGRTTSRPPMAIPPAGNLLDCASDGFDFTVLGGRVPAVIVSPYVARGSTIRALRPSGPPGPWPFDHTSIIRTVWECFDLTSPAVSSLTDRDAAAPSLLPFLTSRNDTGPCPVDIAPRPISPPARPAVTLDDYIARRRRRPEDRLGPQAP